MIRAASYSATGMYAGRIVVHRQITGPQRWLVRLKLEVPVEGGYERIEREVYANEPVPLFKLGPIADQACADLMPDGGTLMVRAASWEAFLMPDPSKQRKARR